MLSIKWGCYNYYLENLIITINSSTKFGGSVVTASFFVLDNNLHNLGIRLSISIRYKNKRESQTLNQSVLFPFPLYAQHSATVTFVKGSAFKFLNFTLSI